MNLLKTETYKHQEEEKEDATESFSIPEERTDKGSDQEELEDPNFENDVV